MRTKIHKHAHAHIIPNIKHITMYILTSSFLTGNLCLNYLANQPNEVYVTQSLTRLLVKVVKLGWFESVNEEHVFRKTIDDVQLFLKVSHQAYLHVVIAIMIELESLPPLLNEVTESLPPLLNEVTFCED